MTRTIVYFTDSVLFGGAEQALLHLLSGLDRRRWKPILYHHDEPGIDPLIEGARRLDIQTRSVPRMVGWQVATALPAFLRILTEERPQVFHAHLCWLLSCKYGLFAAALAQVPVVIATNHNYMVLPWGRTVPLQQRLVNRCVDQYIAVSQAIALQMQQTFHVPSQKIRVIHNGVPDTRFNCPSNLALRAELGGNDGRPLILTVARLDYQKGHSYLFQAIRQVPDAIFVLAGMGPEEKSLMTQASDLGIRDRVVFLGYRNDVPELLASCELFVLPSLFEGLPLAVLEAMAAGKAVIATSVGGTPEAVVDGETGLLVPPKDPTALARAIQKLLSNPTLTRKMADAGRTRARCEFSLDSMLNQVFQTYDELLTPSAQKYRPSNV